MLIVNKNKTSQMTQWICRHYSKVEVKMEAEVKNDCVMAI